MMGMVWNLLFWVNSNSWACLLGSGLKFIFHCTAHSEILVRSLFRLTKISRLCISKTIKFPKLIPVENLHSTLSMIITDHLKLLFVGDFWKSTTYQLKLTFTYWAHKGDFHQKFCSLGIEFWKLVTFAEEGTYIEGRISKDFQRAFPSKVE